MKTQNGAVGTTALARRGLQRGHDVPTLHLLQGPDAVRRRSANSRYFVRGRSVYAAAWRNGFTGSTRGRRQRDQIRIDFQDGSLAQHDGTLNHVLELAHVSRPLVSTEGL